MTDEFQPASAGTPSACLDKRWLKLRYNPEEVPHYMREVHGLTIAKATLNKLRCIGGGPAFRKFGRSVMYDRTSLDAWAEQKLSPERASTSAAA
jgi:hypothetical protein